MSKRYAMVIDQRRCVGCHTCSIACKSENNMPNGASMALTKVITENSNFTDVPVGDALKKECDIDTFNRVRGTLRLDFLTRSCQHCVDAPCVKNCPSGSTYIRQDGIVTVNTDTCIGCMQCMQDCPYEIGAMRVFINKPEFTPTVENEGKSIDFNSGSQEISPSRDKTVKKCTFCAHRVDDNKQPFCVENCPAGARYFGDINDTTSDVYKLTHGSRKTKQPFETRDNGEKPKGNVYFIEG